MRSSAGRSQLQDWSPRRRYVMRYAIRALHPAPDPISHPIKRLLYLRQFHKRLMAAHIVCERWPWHQRYNVFVNILQSSPCHSESLRGSVVFALTNTTHGISARGIMIYLEDRRLEIPACNGPSNARRISVIVESRSEASNGRCTSSSSFCASGRVINRLWRANVSPTSQTGRIS